MKPSSRGGGEQGADASPVNGGPSARVLAALAICAALLAIVPSDVAGRGLLPPLTGSPDSQAGRSDSDQAIAVKALQVRQRGAALTVRVRLASPPRDGDLRPGGRRLCVGLRGHAAPAELACVRRGKHPTVTVHRQFGGSETHRVWLAVRGRTLRVRLPFRAVHVRRGRLAYAVLTIDPSCPSGAAGCSKVFPGGSPHALRVVRPRLIGCRRRGRAVVHGGPRGGRRVALTFDDGPGPSTPKVLRALRRAHVHATFFQLGKEVRGHRRLERRMLAAGHTLADHSYSHPHLPSRAQLAGTRSLIRRYTGFDTCLFRPPYGDVNRRLVHDSVSLGMTAVVWNDDPQDWRTPGTASIVRTELSEMRPGAIVIMHDGGGPRGQTAAAIPRIVHRLRRRGYRFVTVDQLLGYQRVYGPR